MSNIICSACCGTGLILGITCRACQRTGLVPASSGDSYKCLCEPRQLFLGGCTCGAFKAQKADQEALERVAVHQARERLMEQRDFLIPPPTPPVTMKAAVGACVCGHEEAEHQKNHSPSGVYRGSCFANFSCTCAWFTRRV